MSNIHELLKRLHSTNEGETICLNYEEVQYVLQMERIIEDQEKKLEATFCERITQCKGCAYSTDLTYAFPVRGYMCNITGYFFEGDHFCSYGKQKEGENNDAG